MVYQSELFAMNALRGKQEQVVKSATNQGNYAQSLFDMQHYAYEHINDSNFASEWAPKIADFAKQYPAKPSPEEMKDTLNELYRKAFNDIIEKAFKACEGKTKEAAWDEAYNITVEMAEGLAKKIAGLSDKDPVAKAYAVEYGKQFFNLIRDTALQKYAEPHYQARERGAYPGLKGLHGGRVSGLRDLDLEKQQTITSAKRAMTKYRAPSHLEQVLDEFLKGDSGFLSRESIQQKVAEKRKAEKFRLAGEASSREPKTAEEKHLAYIEDRFHGLDDVHLALILNDDGKESYSVETMGGQYLGLAETYLEILDDMEKLKVKYPPTENVFKKIIPRIKAYNKTAQSYDPDLQRVLSQYSALKNITYGASLKALMLEHIIDHNLELTPESLGGESAEGRAKLLEKVKAVTVASFLAMSDENVKSLFGKSNQSHKAVYKALSITLHPDKHPDNQKEAEKAFKRMTDAYNTLEK